MCRIKKIKKIVSREEVKAELFEINEVMDLCWLQLGIIRVQCPKCNAIQIVRTIKKRTCCKCGTFFEICPRKKQNRVVWCRPDKHVFLIRLIEFLEKERNLLSPQEIK